ncbi:MAG: xanthine dehydrogenase family protein subunit M [Comamonadaceae bacterium]|nr:MAG: xanthine dehydrogenase family protein subunit M [Comamonadaceae bacterium]
MNNFSYSAATTVDAALAQIGSFTTPASGLVAGKFIAGGTNLIDLMKENVVRPERLIDINGLSLDTIEETADGGLRLGALARNADTAYHPLVEQRYPLLSAAILAGASPQIRNMASNGGNLLQRTRCYYFYDTGVPCNKREPGTGCPAISGLARQHAILGTSEHCIATHPSDMCVALAALDATVVVQSPRGVRQIPFGEFHRLPGDRPDLDNTLAADELILHIELPPGARFAGHSAYLKLRDRASYAFALVSAAAALDVDDGGRICAARIALGGVAHKPWRDPAVETQLVGQLASAAVFARAAAVLLEGATAYGVGPGSNAFKIDMARRAVVRALETALLGTVRNTGKDQLGHENRADPADPTGNEEYTA